MEATKLDYLNGVLYAQGVSDIAEAIESQIRKSHKNNFSTDQIDVFCDGLFYKVYADVIRYDDQFNVTVYAYDVRDCINDSMSADIEDILIESFESQMCENTHDIYNEQICY